MNGVLLALFLFAVVAKSLGVGQYYIPSQSMAPTLLPSDTILAIPIRDLGALDRGDILVFRAGEPGKTYDYVKRLIGLPGDRVQMIGGRLHLNGRQVMRERTEAIDFNDEVDWSAQYRETLPGGVSYRIAEDSDETSLDNTPEFIVPAGHLFFLGDYRDRSIDSRASMVGFVATEDVIGRAWAIYWSDDLSRIGWVAD